MTFENVGTISNRAYANSTNSGEVVPIFYQLNWRRTLFLRWFSVVPLLNNLT